jgi:hypothetical protein
MDIGVARFSRTAHFSLASCFENVAQLFNSHCAGSRKKRRKGVFRNKNGYEEIVKTFITSGNKVNAYDISTVEKSRYAIPLEILNQIQGETTMSWTGFALEMRDGRYVVFGTTFLFEFFDLPDNYTFDDVVRVHNHSYVSKRGALKALKEGYLESPKDYDASTVCREKP